MTIAATPTIGTQRETIVQQSPVKAEAMIRDPDVGESQGDTCHETPMADAKLVEKSESCALVTAKDAMTNTISTTINR